MRRALRALAQRWQYTTQEVTNHEQVPHHQLRPRPSILALVGCTSSYDTGEFNTENFEQNFEEDFDEGFDEAPVENLGGDREVIAADLNGDFPGVDTQGSASMSSSFDGYSTYVDASLFSDDGALMALIDIYTPDGSGFSDPAFQPGSRTVFENGFVVDGSSNAEVYSTNCAGTSLNFDIDEPASEVIIEAEEGDNEGETIVTINSRSSRGNLETTLLVR